MGGMKMGNIVSRAGIEPTSFAFWASVLTISPSRLPDVTTLPIPTCLGGTLPEMSVQTTTIVLEHCYNSVGQNKRSTVQVLQSINGKFP